MGFIKMGLCLLAPILIGSIGNAQQDSFTHKVELIGKEISTGIQTSRVSDVHGTISVITPAQIQSGDRISGTIILTPIGDSESKRLQNLAILKGKKVTILGSTINANSATFTVMVPASSASVVIDDTTIDIVVLAANTLPLHGDTQPLSILCDGQPSLTIPGKFDGDARNTACVIGNQIAIVLAESPRLIAVSVPSWIKGIQSVRVSEDRVSLGNLGIIGL